jgi:uncharacterized membrane protein/protein-disulfide isomerase
MARHQKTTSAGSASGRGAAPVARPVRWLVVAALAGLAFALASTWVHYQILRDPLYSSFCDVSTTFSCTEAYTSQYGSIAGIPVALLGVLYFAFMLGLIALCRRSAASSANLPGYVFAASTLGLAGVLYFAYASFFILKAVCLLCVGSYAAIIALFVLSGAATRYPMSTLPSRASRDLRALVRTPAALTAALGFVVAAVLAVVFFPSEPISASAALGSAPSAAAPATSGPAASSQQAAGSTAQQLEAFLSSQPRVPLLVAGGGAAVVIVKFNDYQCPPCRQTFMQYKPILAKLQQQNPGKIAFITRDFPLDPECNSLGGPHPAACEAAVAVRLAREKGMGDVMEDWLFANQPSLTTDSVKAAVQSVAGITDFNARYATTLELVRGDIAQGQQVGVRSTPSFFMNGMRLPNWPGELFEAAVNWELRRVAATAGK